MNQKIEQILNTTLSNWKAMSAPLNEDAEPVADQFESSFYLFIDAVREWFHGLDPQPRTLEEFLALPLMTEIKNQLPAPLHLNFETEAELIFENQTRIEDSKYD